MVIGKRATSHPGMFIWPDVIYIDSKYIATYEGREVKTPEPQFSQTLCPLP
jgi:hypothetical protein